MKELFRFAVVRPANVSQSSTTPLSPRGSLSTDFQFHLLLRGIWPDDSQISRAVDAYLAT
jgi:hypothetical protein